MANETQKEKELLAKYEGAVAKLEAAIADREAAMKATDEVKEASAKQITELMTKLEAAEAEVKKAQEASKAAGSGKEVAELRASNKKLLGELAEVKSALEATRVRPGQYLAVSRIKEDGETYLPGSIYKGSRSKELLASGSLKLA